ncbi:hypothetical protein JVT61DRAFT_12097 [Boletus reticuloceps]|uniref:Uncharacterized protein n=1 Tax=Boletus reticuloceps TaxID=495285 RepID=A0A8I2YEA7_9AGAM|nr:hypothetical protein JVT61DRAFT_12097 [Boletus reticuloceps]
MEALQMLSQIYSTPFTSITTHTRNADQNANEDSGEDGWSGLDSEGTALWEGLSGYIDVPNETASRAHKNLQQENVLAEGSQHFLKVFGEVDQVCQ